MKKFEFSLSRMLDYKNRILDEEQGALQRLRHEKEELDRRIGLLEQQFQQVSAKLHRAEREGTTALELGSYNLQLTNIRLQLEQLRKVQLHASQEVDRQTRVVVSANQEVSKLDKLHDKQYEVYQKGVEKAEELRIEELVSIRSGHRDAV